ncbi:autotransporter domain-containing protein [Hyphomicrobium sulfonivorans]|uniref:autotransporter domain-containing protein n=1 Tax=Hyphomicrobium sulfonivorans TaxID=121290 RepID=UPI00156E9B92|nr:autotransporter domain-containing protein [Hyphomicrobium sulfonivorans]NSL71912.1 hypothetical protein [Hyphomicrobium sulfonivorans]
MSAIALAAALFTSAPVMANGGQSGGGTTGGGDSLNGVGSIGLSNPATGGGGGGAGLSGASGGNGTGAGGAGGVNPGDNGQDGSSDPVSGGGGGGAAHGAVRTELPDIDGVVFQGGTGGSGGSSTDYGGGGGSGGWGLVVDGSNKTGAFTGTMVGGLGGNAGLNGGGWGGSGGVGYSIFGANNTVTVNGAVTGGDGGDGGHQTATSGRGGNGGSGGFGAWLIGNGNQTTFTGPVTGGNGGRAGSDGSGGPAAGGQGGYGIYGAGGVTIGGAVTGGNGGNIFDFGTVGAGGEGVSGSNMEVTVLSTGSVSGGFSGDGATQANAIRFLAGINRLTVHAGASLSGAVTGDGNDNFVLGGSTDGSIDYSTQFSGFLWLEKRDASTWTLTGNNFVGAAAVEEGRLNVDGQIGSAASTHVVNSGATLGGSGTIVGNVDLLHGVLAPGGAFNSLTVTRGMQFLGSSIFRVGVTAAGQNDKLLVGEAVWIDPDAIVDVLAQPGKYMPSTQYTIITSTGGIAGQFNPNITTNMAFLSPSLSYDTNNVYLTLANTHQFVDAAQTYNENAVAGALDTLDFNDPLYQAVIGQTAEGARQAYNAMSGEIYASTQGVLIDQARFARGSILDRLLQSSYAQGAGGQQMALGAGGPTTFAMASAPMEGRMGLGMGDGSGRGSHASAPGPAYSDGLVFWTQGFGSWGSYDGNGNAATVDRTLGGFVSGVDAGLGDGWRAGVAAGYARSNLKVGARNSSSQIDSYTVAAYAGGPIGSFALRAGGTWTWSDIEASRAVVFPGFASLQQASYNGDIGQLFAELAHPFVSGVSAIEPFAGLAWVHLNTDGFTESGGAAALAVRGSNENVGYSSLGLRAATTLPMGGVLVTPRASAAWQYAFGDTTPDLALAFVSSGASFGILGVPLARSSALLEAGLDIQLSEDAVLGVSYVGQLAGDLQDNGVQGKILWKF